MDETIVVVDVATGAYYSLNETASLVWQAIAEGNGTEDAVCRILGEYEVEAPVLREHVSACVVDWLKEGLICDKGVARDEKEKDPG
ncbi:MAG TPA: PqqD family protein [Planctomycetota bacterium]|nr:PqqD family protein [Planctomycetota bacterium]